jgi:hypothetical protein
MFRKLTTVLLATVLPLAIGCSKPEFKEFSPSGGGFKVLMPGTPKEERSSPGGIPMTTYTSDERNGGYAIICGDLPIPDNESPAQIQTRLDGSRDGGLKNMGGKFISESQIQLGGKYPGRDVRADVPSKQAYARLQIFLVHKRLYSILAMGTQSWVNSADTDKFFNSFALTEK